LTGLLYPGKGDQPLLSRSALNSSHRVEEALDLGEITGMVTTEISWIKYCTFCVRK
jgi:hypothetical protein